MNIASDVDFGRAVVSQLRLDALAQFLNYGGAHLRIAAFSFEVGKRQVLLPPLRSAVEQIEQLLDQSAPPREQPADAFRRQLDLLALHQRPKHGVAHREAGDHHLYIVAAPDQRLDREIAAQCCGLGQCQTAFRQITQSPNYRCKSSGHQRLIHLLVTLPREQPRHMGLPTKSTGIGRAGRPRRGPSGGEERQAVADANFQDQAAQEIV